MNTNRKIIAAILFTVAFAYAFVLWPLPSINYIQGDYDKKIIEAALQANWNAWAWSVIIIITSLCAAFMLIFNVRFWQLILFIGLLEILIISQFPSSISLFITDDLGRRIATLSGSPKTFAAILAYGIISPLLYIVATVLIMFDYIMNKPSNQRLHSTPKSGASEA